MVTEVWLSTLLPGMLLGILFMAVNYFTYGRKQPKVTEPFYFKQYLTGVQKTVPRALVAFIMPLIIFGGVYGGGLHPCG